MLGAAVSVLAAAALYYHYWGFLDYPRALEAFERAEAGLPGDASVIAAKSFVQRRSGRLEESVETLRRAISFDPRNPHLVENLVMSFLHLQRWDDAREQAEILHRLSPDDLRFQESFIRLFETGDPFPELAQLREGRALLELGNLGMAVRLARAYDIGQDLMGAFDDVQPRQPDWTSKSAVEGEWLSLAGRSDEASAALRTARSELEDLLLSDPEDHRLYSTLGIVLAYQGDIEGARSAGERAVELMGYADDPLSAPWARHALAGIYAITGATDDALGSLETLLTHDGMFSAGFIAQDPRFDSLRSDPRFAELLRKHGWNGALHERPEGF